MENPKYDEMFYKAGGEDWNVKIAGKKVLRRIKAEDVRRRLTFLKLRGAVLTNPRSLRGG